MEELNVNEQVETETVETTENTQEVAKTYTQEELDKLLQAETDRKTSKALETAKAKWESDFKAKLESEKSEAEKLAKMSESERYEVQLKSEREAFEEERKEFRKSQLESETVKQLASKSLPTQFSSYIKGETAEEIISNINEFESQWISALQKAVDEKLQGNTPQASNKVATSMSKVEFNALPMNERTKLYTEQPEMVRQILES